MLTNLKISSNEEFDISFKESSALRKSRVFSVSVNVSVRDESVDTSGSPLFWCCSPMSALDTVNPSITVTLTTAGEYLLC